MSRGRKQGKSGHRVSNKYRAFSISVFQICEHNCTHCTVRLAFCLAFSVDRVGKEQFTEVFHD